ncbi:Mitochondrial distribution and morphology protein 10 [Erysiphe neolycopersici]|uniref:Mitochondrial distribution and morphology protein 10 n=1 Tax=Erysiphe neolycopersici TaxID=212602 RepID=A0A420HQX1_9PEZI|nr:Mitochondrial distribution and morphology protein 10 [Erysiphe neolycopersici]
MMLDFMDYVKNTWHLASQWDQENSYSQLTSTARAVLEFEPPMGLRLHLSSLSSPNFATSYSLGSTGLVDGSISYLYSSIKLHPQSKTSQIDLHQIIHGYKQIQELRKSKNSPSHPQWDKNENSEDKGTLMYGRMYLPCSTLEALYLRRLSSTQQLSVSAVSDRRLKNNGTILALHQYDTGKYSTESLYSTDGGLIGIRGLYNFGVDARKNKKLPVRIEDRFYGRFSIGTEIYYGSLNKSGGMSFGGRFATLPAHKGIPLISTLTLNPLMGNVSTTYAVKAGKNLSLCSRFDFNFYSYESDLVLGAELWRMKNNASVSAERSMAAKLEWRQDSVEEKLKAQEEVAGVFKVRADQNWRIGLLWEGRVKELLFTLGSFIDMKRLDQPLGTIGLELRYSS